MEAGKVEGAKLIELFKQVIESRIIISLHVAGTGYHRLTCVTGLRTGPPENCLVVDRPKGFRLAVAGIPAWDLRFNFNGPDQLEYLFSTSGGQVDGDGLLIPLPAYVERVQRRRNFRVDAPVRGRMRLELDGNRCMLQLINISLGGVLGALLRYKTTNIQESGLRVGREVENMTLTFPPDSEMAEQTVTVLKSEVRRVEFDRDKKLHRFAFEFMEIDKEEERKLTSVIYHLQRQYLRRR